MHPSFQCFENGHGFFSCLIQLILKSKGTVLTDEVLNEMAAINRDNNLLSKYTFLNQIY